MRRLNSVLAALVLAAGFSLLTNCSGGKNGSDTSGNCNLSNIAISDGITLSPSFNSDVTSYSAVVSEESASCSMTVFAGHKSQSIEANDDSVGSGESFEVDLPRTENLVAIKATAENGNEKIYLVTIKKSTNPSAEASLSNITVKSSETEDLSPSFDPEILSYDAYIASTESSVRISAVSQSAGASITIDGDSVESGANSDAISVERGSSKTVAIHVSAQDGVSTKDYSVTIHRAGAQSNNAYLSALTLSSAKSWDKIFSKNSFAYSVTVANGTSSVKITPTVEDAGKATVTVDSVAVASGSESAAIELEENVTRSVEVTVSAEDSTRLTYTLNITREGSLSENAYLSSLSLGAIALSPDFSKVTNTYSATVSSQTTSVTICATVEDAKSTLKINGEDYTAGTPAAIALSSNLTQIAVEVASESGKLNTYIINVTKSSSLIVYFEKPSSWPEDAWIWFDSDPSTPAWNTTTLKTSPGDMTKYRTAGGLDWYKKDFGSISTVTFLFNGGTWVYKVIDKSKNDNFTETKTCWIRADGTVTYTDPVVPAPPVITISPAGGTFSSDTCNVSVSISSGSPISEMKYTLVKNNDAPVTANLESASSSINIAAGTVVGDIVKLQATALNSTGRTTTAQYSFERVETPPISDDVDNLRIYQIMVESFQDGDGRYDYNTGYGPSHHKGDLRGIINAIPYIKSLGCNAIWLTPIFNSNGSSQLDATGYFAYDYFNIDPKFGTLQDAKDLVKAAHDANMYVFLDGVFGHHKASDWAASPSGYKPTGNTVISPFGDNNYGVDYNDSNTVNFYKEVATYWIDQLGIDGWRLDQAYQIHKNKVNCWDIIVSAVKAKCTERKNAGQEWGTLGYMVGEIWKGESEIKTYGYGNEGFNGLESCFDFPMRYNLVQVLATEESMNYTDRRGNTSYLSNGYSTHSSYPTHAHPNLMLTNHDLARFGDLIQRAGLGGKENSDYWKRHKAAFAFMTSYTGPITVYYGDEIGDEVNGYVYNKDLGYYDDHVSRSSGQISGFDSNQQALHDYVAKLMSIRNDHPALWNGTRTNLLASANKYADLKVSGSDKVLFVMNAASADTTITLGQSSVGGSTLKDLADDSSVSASGGNYAISVPALGARLLQVR